MLNAFRNLHSPGKNGRVFGGKGWGGGGVRSAAPMTSCLSFVTFNMSWTWTSFPKDWDISEAKNINRNCNDDKSFRLRAVHHFSSRIVERVKRERAWKSPHARKGDTRGVIFTRARVSRALLSLRKNEGLLVVYKSTKKRNPQAETATSTYNSFRAGR